MNVELIEELRWQAGVTIDGFEFENIAYAFTPQMLEEYTKLVVQECIRVVEETNLVDDDPVINIKEHFGVK